MLFRSNHENRIIFQQNQSENICGHLVFLLPSIHDAVRWKRAFMRHVSSSGNRCIDDIYTYKTRYSTLQYVGQEMEEDVQVM